MFIPPTYLLVSLEVVGGILGVSIAVYCALSKPSGLKVAHPDVADVVRVAKLAYPEGIGIKRPVVNPKIDLAGLKFAHPDAADTVHVAKQLIEILFFDPESYINMPDHSQFIEGLFWLACPGGIKGPIFNPAGLKVAHDMVGVAKQLLKILSFDPRSYINMPDHCQFIKGLYWLAYPEGIGIKLPVVNPKIDPVESPKIELDAIAVVNPRVGPVEVVEVAEDGNLRINMFRMFSTQADFFA